MNEQVIIGTLKEPHAILHEGKKHSVEPADWDHRAMWSYLRLQFKKKIADERIQKHFDMIQTMKDQRLSRQERKHEMSLLFADLLKEQKKPREIQFILDANNKVIAVASLKHLLIPPSEVYDMADKILEVKYPKMKLAEVNEILGLCYTAKSTGDFDIGLQIYGGTITTRQAITVTSWLRVILCLNPLSWLGIGGLGHITTGTLDFERVLRIKKKAELQPRLEDAIKLAVSNIEAIESRVDHAQNQITKEDARILMSAMGLSYSLGAKTIKQVLNRFEKEPKTQYGLSMAASWVAAHGTFKKTPEGQNRVVEQTLSTIAGATLLLEDVKAAKHQSLGWLKQHVREGRVKTIQELVGDLIK